jgi:hypothetical protein
MRCRAHGLPLIATTDARRTGARLAGLGAVLLAMVAAPLPAVAYQNPIGIGAHAKDPSVLVEDGTYYVFSSFTGDAVLAGNVPVQRSTDP